VFNSNSTLVAKTEVGTSSFYPNEKILVNIYKGRLKIDEALHHLKITRDFYTKNTVHGSITDLSKVYGSIIKVMNHLNANYPAIVESGLTCTAFVVTKDILLEAQTEKLQALLGNFNIRTEVFFDIESAFNWVKTILEK